MEGEWVGFLNGSKEDRFELLCRTLSRIASPLASMPPLDSPEEKSFVTYKASVLLSLQTLVQRYQYKCKSL